jgi:ATP-dependent Lhr-like helicase
LLTGAWEGGAVRVLYVSPLKALNSDIERNLRSPLAELRREMASSGFDPPAVHVAVRSGDTPPAERARMLRRAPEILITTPESLNLLLLSARAESLLSGVRTVILDEIHAVVSNKRGTHLITAVDRLVRLAGEFQRVAMSATVRPVERVARFVGGWQGARAAGGEVRHEPRPVAVLAARSDKRYDLSVRFPFPPAGEADELREGDAFWRRLAEDLYARIRESRSTIVFTNSRRLAEKATRFVNEAAGREIAWSHHGSLSRELRRAVEERLKAGSLPAIVATSSLELGIDVGALDRVLLLQSPRTLSSAAQRVGRAGHGVGEVSRAVFYPTHARDFLDCAVAVAAVRAGEIEPVRPVRSPLDLLAQTVLACVARERWALDELYDFLRGSDPFHELAREQFDLVVEMLAGRYAQVRVEELRPRVAIDRIAGTIEGRPGLARLLARAGGTIPDRGYFQLRVEGSKAKLGELDEEFVWERSVGDGFVLGAQAWRVSSIGANEVLVTPARGGALLAPFWRADARDREAFFSGRVADLLERAEARLGHPDFADELAAEHGFEPAAASELVRLLREQRAALGVPLPHRRHLVFEEAPAHGEGAERRQVVLYTFWGGSVNRPLALALTALWQEREGTPLETIVDDDAVLFVLPPGVDARELLLALEPGA